MTYLLLSSCDHCLLQIFVLKQQQQQQQQQKHNIVANVLCLC